jgi:hypothetical protein
MVQVSSPADGRSLAVFLGQKLAALAFIIAAAWDPSALSVVPIGFLTGGDYLQQSESERQG